MSLLEDMFKGGNVVTGVGAVIGAAVLAPVVLPVVRTLAKTVIKAGLVAYDQGRVMGHGQRHDRGWIESGRGSAPGTSGAEVHRRAG